MDEDYAIRLTAFNWLKEMTLASGDVLTRDQLQKGFDFKGKRIPLVSPQGIFKPQGMNYPLTITSIPGGPYQDKFSSDGWLAYRYRGTDPKHTDNQALRRAFLDKKPLIFLQGIVAGKYLPVWPVFVVGDDPGSLTFKVAADDSALFDRRKEVQPAVLEQGEERRRYITSTIKVRLHQTTFRERVLEAYRLQCSLCKLRHTELLEAAHIIPDNMPEGEPKVTNGISLCKLHHAAFDNYIIGVSPDYKVFVRDDILKEFDGPVLQYALKEMHGNKIILPTAESQWPSRESLEWKFEKFSSYVHL